MNSKLISDLKKSIPSSNILTELEERYAYSQDASNIKGKIPDVVVFVENTQQVIDVVNFARKHKTPIICRGAGTNVVGACTANTGGIILNFCKMNKILEINKINMTAKVQPGVVVGDLQKEVERYGLFYPPDPSNLAVSTMGASIALNSGGAKSFKYGTTKDYVMELKIVTSDGNLLMTGSQTIKNAAGYNLNTLFVGSEGTLGIVVEATVKLIPKPQSKKVIMAYFESIQDTLNAVNSVIEHRVYPTTIDFMDKNAVQTVEKFYPSGLLTDKEALLLIEVDGEACSVDYQEQVVKDILKDYSSCIKSSSNDEEYDKIWSARRSSMGACAKLKPNVTTDDVIVPRNNLAELVLGIRDICERYNLDVCMVGHIGDGSVHPQIPIDYENEDEYKRYKAAKSEIYDLTAKLEGIISGEHGIGIEKKGHISKFVNSVSLDYMKQIKLIFDKDNILNPYKIF